MRCPEHKQSSDVPTGSLGFVSSTGKSFAARDEVQDPKNEDLTVWTRTSEMPIEPWGVDFLELSRRHRGFI